MGLAHPGRVVTRDIDGLAQIGQEIRGPERLVVNKLEFRLASHAHRDVLRRVTIQIVDHLKGDGQPEAKHNNEQQGQLVGEVGVLGEHEVACGKEDILGVEQQVVDEVAETGAARLQVKVDENVDERADKVVELLEDLLACIVDVERGDAVVGLEPQDPEVHDHPVGEYDHEEPGAECAGENGHR